jgi:ribosomal protein L22
MADDKTPDADADASQSKPAEKAAAPRRRAAAKKPAEAKAEAVEKPSRTRAAAKKADDAPATAKAPRARAAKKPAAESAEPVAAAAAKPAAKAASAAKPARRGAAAKESPKRRGPSVPLPADFTVRAQARYVRSSARKARLVCNHIRGKSVPEARAVLAFAPRGVAKDWSKLLNSAVANAENNHELIGDELTVTAVYADEGPTLKRFKPRAMGRATPIHKRTSHLTIELGAKE